MGSFDDISNSPSLALSLGRCLLTQETTSSHFAADESLFNFKPKTFSTALSLPPSVVNETTVSSFRESATKASSASMFSKREYSGSDGHVACDGIIDEDEEEGSPRKKLRLTKDQSAILEDCFKQSTTLNIAQKQALAEQLNLRLRQVEVWFQNRRARMKLKLTEAECELLKKCCEALTKENKMLQRQVQELKSLKEATTSFYTQLSMATLSVCPSCERVGGETTLPLAVGPGVKP